MAKGFNLKAIFSADTKDIEKGSAKATESVKDFERFSKSAFGGVDKGASVAGKKVQALGKSIGALATKFAAAAISIRSLIAAIKTIADFEKANSTLAAVLGTTQRGIEKLTESAIDLGRKTEYTASQVTELQTELAKLGFSEPQIIAMQESVLKFAAAVGTDLASAAARAGATMRGFDLTAEETGDMLATMAVSTSKSALSFLYLDDSLGKLVPVTKSFGLNVKSTVALLGTLANAGIDSSSATTALRNTVIELANAESKLTKAIGSQPRSMDELLSALVKLRDRNISVAEASDLVGKRAAPAFLALLNGVDTCRELYGELQNVNTALDDMYTTMTDNVEGSVNKLKSAWEAFTLSLRDSKGPIKWIIDRLTDLVQLINLGISGYKSAKIDERVESKKREWLDANMTPEEMQVEVDYRQNRIDRAKESGASKKEIKGLVEEFLVAFNAMQGLTKPSSLSGTDTTGGKKGGSGSGGDGGNKKKSKTSDELKKLQDEAREYAAAEQEVIEADKEMEAEAARLYESYKSLHPAIEGAKVDVDKLTGLTDEQKATLLSVIQPIDNTAQGVVALANRIATLVELDQSASSATNQFAEQLYGLGDAFQAVVYAAGLTDEQLTEEVNKLWDQWVDGLSGMQETSKEFSAGIREILLDAMEDTLVNVGTFIGEALTLGFDTAASNLGTNMLDTLGTLVQRLGELCLAVGEGIFSIKESLYSLNPYVALAAGAALVMLGAAVKSAASNLASGMGTYSSSRSLSDSYSPYSTGELETRTLNIRVTGRLLGDGRNLIGVIQEAETYTNHTT